MNDDDSIEIAGEGGIAAVAKALDNHPTAVAVQEQACCTLYMVAGNDDSRMEIAREGGIAAIVKALDKHPTAVAVQVIAC